MMRLTARRRAALAVVLSWPIGYLYLDWAVYTGLDLGRHFLTGNTICDGSWRQFSNGCGPSFHPVLAWAELVLVTSVVLAVVAVLVLWVMRPVQNMADLLSELGPTSLALRMPTDGPREETRALAGAINDLLARVRVGYEAQRRFAANASHELRTPLATQRALIEISLSSSLTPDQLELLSRQLLATNERNEHLVEGLLVLAETEQGLLTVRGQRLDEITGAVLEMLQPAALERDVTLKGELDRVEVPGEHALLERLVVNLVQNAIKYNAAGGWVQVRTETAEHGGATLLVANSGPIVAAHDVDGLFEPFRRASGDRLEHGGGVGLGLTIARSVVAAHGGSIAASANPDGGLTVTVTLPA